MQGFTTRYVHTEYGMGFVITRVCVEDDQYDVVAPRKAKGLAFSVATTLNTLGAAVYNNSTSYLGGDGKALLANDHPNIAGGTQDNLSSSTLSESALESALIAISKLTNDRGLKIQLQAQQLIIPVDLQFTAERILNSPLRVDTANNDLNALKTTGKLPGGYSVNHFLTGTTSWYLKTNAPDGMKAFMRRKPEFTMDNDFDTDNAKYKVTFRCSFGWTDWRALYGYDV
jgi:phage major head subunit gpT-like protein